MYRRDLKAVKRNPEGRQYARIRMKGKLRNVQKEAIQWMREREEQPHHGVTGGLLCLTMGLGKCSRKDTPILMWDGSIKMVQNVQVGDVLCGDDSSPRTVKVLGKGKGMMYEVSSIKHDSYVVNGDHILSLHISGNRSISLSKHGKYILSWFDHTYLTFYSSSFDDYDEAVAELMMINSPDILDITVKDFIGLPKHIQQRLKGYKVGVEWTEQDTPVHPYMLGVWLGDGSSYSPQITNVDSEILDWVEEWSITKGYSFQKLKSSKIQYSITGGLHKELRELNLLKNKHVPHIYKRNSMQVRLQVLAGLIDSDGYLVDNCYEITQKNKQLAQDILYLARSCGIGATTRTVKKGCWYKGEYKEGYYERIFLSGHIDKIPVKIKRKRTGERKQLKNALVSQISVKEVGVDDYYGFVIDGNRRYLMGDFTVTHNTVSAISHSLTAPRPPTGEVGGENGWPTLIICSKTLMGEWRTQGFNKFFGNTVSVLYYHKDYIGANGMKNITRHDIVSFDFVVTTYDVIVSAGNKNPIIEEILERGDVHSLYKDKVIACHLRTRDMADDPDAVGKNILFRTPWERVIMDESQRVCNPTTKTWRYLMSVYGKHKWGLTGTPIRNYTTDIWSQLRWCGFDKIITPVQWKKSARMNMVKFELLRCIMNSDYVSAGISMPNLIERTVEHILEDDELRCYKMVMKVLEEAYDKMMEKLTSFMGVLTLFMRLRQSCIAPYLMTADAKRDEIGKEEMDRLNALQRIAEDGSLGKWIYDKDGTAGIYSSRITEIIGILQQIPPGEKTLVFTSFTSASDLLAYAIEKRLPDYPYIQIDGGVVGVDRDNLLDKFRNDPTVRVLIMTYKVGGEGLNLTCAQHCVMIEPWWNYAVQDQAKARSWRAGQIKDVTNWTVITTNTIEKGILAMCQEKKRMGKIMLGEETGVIKKIGLGKHELQRLMHSR